MSSNITGKDPNCYTNREEQNETMGPEDLYSGIFGGPSVSTLSQPSIEIDVRSVSEEKIKSTDDDVDDGNMQTVRYIPSKIGVPGKGPSMKTDPETGRKYGWKGGVYQRKKTTRVFTKEEADAMLAQCETQEQYISLLLGRMVPTRVEEARGIQMRDLDVVRNRIYVPSNKSDSGRRWVPVHASDLMRVVRYCKDRNFAKGTCIIAKCRSTLNTWLKKVAELAGVDIRDQENVRWHGWSKATWVTDHRDLMTDLEDFTGTAFATLKKHYMRPTDEDKDDRFRELYG